METFIRELIDRKKIIYRDDYHEMLGDFGQEQETVKGYNGRQILELLQNCDDEGSKEVLIELNKSENTIAISNNGKPFSKAGYRSLFIPHLSSKDSKRQFIGNKGLGFRSILNWSDAIEIKSNGLLLKYTSENRIKVWEELFSAEIRKEIKDGKDYQEHIIPIPFLAVPHFPVQNEQEDYVTTIVIHYQDKFYENIIEQIDEITPETILFLRSVKEIRFLGFDGKEDIKCEKEDVEVGEDFSFNQIVRFDDTEWRIFEMEASLPKEYADETKNEDEFYQIKIAVEKDFKKSSKNLYSFFPTNILLKQPYILHATFELDSTRNQLVKSDKNEFLLKQVAEFTLQLANYYKAQEVSYKPLNIIFHQHSADTLAKLGYYELINRYLANEDLYPCVDERYSRYDRVVYVNEEFAKMLIDINAGSILTEHLIPLNDQPRDEIGLKNGTLKKLSEIFIIECKLNDICKLNLTLIQRTNFVISVFEHCSFVKSKHPDYLSLLIDRDKEIISGATHIYTPISGDKELEIPTFAKIQFVHPELYEALLSKFGYDEKDQTLGKGRFFYEKLKGFCNIHSYEPATLAEKIIRETESRIIGLSTDGQVRYIKEMHKCLFNNFMLLDENTKNTPLRLEKIKIPCITKHNQKEYTERLTFSSHYNAGKFASLIFENTQYANYVATPDQLGIAGFKDDDVEDYLKWIGINKFLKFTENNDDTNAVASEYIKWLCKVKGLKQNTGEIKTKRLISFPTIVANISVEQFIFWIHVDRELFNQLSNTHNSDSVTIKGHGNVYDKPSFLKYELEFYSKYKFTEHLIDDKIDWINKNRINYNDPIFISNNIQKDEINSVLEVLGAKREFNDLTIDRVTDILNSLSRHYPDGSHSQTIYKKALAHYGVNKKRMPYQIGLFAKNSTTKIKLYPNQIYFSDKIKLPKRLWDKYPIFNFPSRAGAVEAISFFGINDLRNVKIEISSKVIAEKVTSLLIDYLEKLKPFLLAVRFNNIEGNIARANQATILNNIKITCCSSLFYKLGEEQSDVEDYEYLFSEDTFYIKVNEFDQFDRLRSNNQYVDSFAEIIASAFDVSSDKNDFKTLFRNHFDDNLNYVVDLYGEDLLGEVNEVLGLTDVKYAFWKSVFESNSEVYDEKIDDLALNNLITEKFKIDFDTQSINYDNIEDSIEIFKILSLLKLIDTPIQTFNNHSNNLLRFTNIHKEKLQNFFNKNRTKIKSSIWNNTKEKDVAEKRNFLHELSKYDYAYGYIDKVSKEHALTFEINIEALFKDFITQNYNNLVLTNDLEIDGIYEGNKSCFNEEQMLRIAEDEHLKSLLYFADEVSYLKELLEKPIPQSEIIIHQELDIESEIYDAEILRPYSYVETTSYKNSGVFSPKLADLHQRKIKGNKCEEIVLKYIKNNLDPNAEYVSRDNEGLHHDLRYHDKNDVIKYVEVKAFDSGKFYLTKDEFAFGKSNKENYEIWLVSDYKKIIPIKDFFDNPKYQPIANEYIVYLDKIN